MSWVVVSAWARPPHVAQTAIRMGKLKTKEPINKDLRWTCRIKFQWICLDARWWLHLSLVDPLAHFDEAQVSLLRSLHQFELGWPHVQIMSSSAVFAYDYVLLKQPGMHTPH